MLSVLHGIQVAGETPAERRRNILALTDEELAARVLEFVVRARSVDVHSISTLAQITSVPEGEVAASPFALRAVALAAHSGAAMAHHECRRPIVWQRELEPPDETLAAAEEWDDGVLEVSKYRSFLQEEPFATFNPNHLSKWSPHELLHRVAKFFWRANASPFELYLGARLNELVPVVLWYSLDEIARLDRPEFLLHADQIAANASLERALWRSEAGDGLVAETAVNLRRAIVHFEREWRTIAAELEELRPLVVRHGRAADDAPYNGIENLDASSDAIAYVAAHRARLKSPAMLAIMDCLKDNHDFFSSIAAYQAHIEQLFDTLVFGEISIPEKRDANEFHRRCLWDFGLRVALHANSIPSRLPPFFSALKQQLNSRDSAENPLPALEEISRGVVRDAVRRDCLALGLPTVPETLDLELLAAGVASAINCNDEAAEQIAQEISATPIFWTRGRLATRVGAFTRTHATLSDWAISLDFDAILRKFKKRDDAVERLSLDGDGELSGGAVYRSSAFEILELPLEIMRVRLNVEASSSADGKFLIGNYLGEVAVVPAPLNVRLLWQELGFGSMPLDEALEILDENAAKSSHAVSPLPDNSEGWVRELIVAGALGYFRIDEDSAS